MLRGCALAAIWLALPAVPAAAQTAVATPAGPHLEFNPEYLAGEELIEVEEENDAIVATPIGGGARRVIAEMAPPIVRVSDTRIVVATYFLPRPCPPFEPCKRPPAEMGEVMTGPLSGPLEKVSDKRCEASPFADVSGDVIAYSDCEGGITIRDYSQGAPATEKRVVLNEPGHGLRLAGRYLLARQDLDYVVYDWVAGSEAYRLAHDSRLVVDEPSLQEDGKTAVTFTDHTRPATVSGLAWASPAEPFLHNVARSRQREFAAPHIRGDRIAFVRHGADTDAGTEIMLADLAGAKRRVARPGWGAVPLRAFDGRRIFWPRASCFDWEIVVQDVDSEPIVHPDRQGCELRFEQPPVVRGKRLRIEPDCAGFTPDCFASRLRVRTVRRFRVPGSARRRRLGVASANGSGEWLILSPRAQELLHTEGRLRVRIIAKLSSFETDVAERRSATVILERP